MFERKKVYRVIEYSVPDDEAGNMWLEGTLARSIDGRMELGGHKHIVGVVALSEYELSLSLVTALDVAHRKPWEPERTPPLCRTCGGKP